MTLSMHHSDEAHHVTAVVREAGLTGQLGFLRAAVHQQVSPQTGRKISEQGKQHRGSCRDDAKRATLLRLIRKLFLRVSQNIPRVFLCHIVPFYSHPAIRFFCDISTYRPHFSAILSLIKAEQTLSPGLSAAPFALLSLHLDDFCNWIICKWKKQKMSVTSLLLGGMHPCLPPLCNSTWHFYYVWNWYNLLSPLGSFI